MAEAPSPPAGFRGTFRTDGPARAVYAEAAGIAHELPLAVAVPADADDVVALVRWAAATRTPLVPRGSGTSMAGGAVGPGVVVDLGRLDTLGAVDVERRRVVVGPGVTRAAVERAASAAGLRFPVDPSSGAYCTVGGMAGTNAAGAHTLRYGATRPWVQALECVFADGTRAWLRRGEPPPARLPVVTRVLDVTPRWRDAAARGLPRHPVVRKDTSGYALAEYLASGELVDLLVGSEGTLALFVGLELRLAPRPAATSSLLAAFPTLEQATDAAARARELGASACELLDRTFLDVAASGGAADVPAGSEAVLLAEVEGDAPDGAAALAGRVSDAFRAAGATEVRLALDARTETVLWELRHRASPTIARLHPELRSMQFIEDGAVPPAQLPAYVRGVREALARHGVRGVIFGHAGDAHVHVNPLVDVQGPAWRRQVAGILDDVTALTERLGGTMAGEHGDGRLRTPLLPRLRGRETMALYAEVKAAFDPAGILNPGVKVPLPDQTPLGAIKYDPALPPLPTSARRVLDHVTRERAYATHRLDLLARADALDAPAPVAAASDVEGETEG
ncbi:MAG TPA: FAD-binding oxidoreductase [Gemmatimonadaceae bacterium]|nr:FAD-binding oxidoreductase [Gemmatimonadaceae bacterium]